jgi:hypothetical protein
MGRVWVLDTGTKGTGAEMVPLEKVLKTPASDDVTDIKEAARKRASRPSEAEAPQPQPSQAPRFKIVDVMTRAVLAEDVGARQAVDLLEDVRSVVDVRVYVWDPRKEQWRILSYRDQKLLWEFRARSRAAASG